MNGIERKISSGLTIRTGSKDDTTRIAEIVIECGMGESGRIYKALDRFIGQFLVAEKDGKIVGTVKAGIGPSDSAQISYLAIDPNYRKQGIAHDLLTVAEGEIREAGFHHAHLVPQNNHPKLIEYYQGLGYHKKVSTDRWTLMWKDFL